MATDIEWTDETWNPTVGCSRVSAGCEHCYAEGVAHRGLRPEHKGLTVMGKHGPRWTGEVRLLPERLAAPLSWRKPRKVFVDSMSDLFHVDVPFEYIAAVFGVMAASRQHTYQVLTKRPERAREWFAWLASERERRLAEAPPRDPALPPFELTPRDVCAQAARAHGMSVGALPSAYNGPWPLPNVWIGTSCENQAAANERIPELLQCPAAVHFVSAEPLLGRIDFREITDGSWFDKEGANMYDAMNGRSYWRTGDTGVGGGPKIDWIIAGGESGSRARPCCIEWIAHIVGQCQAAGVACFVKQLGSHSWEEDPNGPMNLQDSKGGDPSEWPEPLRVRQLPEVAHG